MVVWVAGSANVAEKAVGGAMHDPMNDEAPTGMASPSRTPTTRMMPQ